MSLPKGDYQVRACYLEYIEVRDNIAVESLTNLNEISKIIKEIETNGISEDKIIRYRRFLREREHINVLINRNNQQPMTVLGGFAELRAPNFTNTNDYTEVKAKIAAHKIGFWVDEIKYMKKNRPFFRLSEREKEFYELYEVNNAIDLNQREESYQNKQHYDVTDPKEILKKKYQDNISKEINENLAEEKC